MAGLSRPAPQAPTFKMRGNKGDVPIVLDEVDRRLLGILEAGLPLVREPYPAIADQAGISFSETLQRTDRLVRNRAIREITAIFDSQALGYDSTLVAARVDPGNPRRSAAAINAHPGVAHNFLRDHEFNLWFTLAVPPDSKFGLDRTVELLREEAHATAMLQLPELKRFKAEPEPAPLVEGDQGNTSDKDRRPDERDIEVIRATQGPMAVTPRPFDDAAAKIGIPVEDLLAQLGRQAERGLLRRVAAILPNRGPDQAASAVAVWNVPEGDLEDLGQRLAGYPEIARCEQRPTAGGWPYSLFLTVRGPSTAECDTSLAAIAAECGIESGDRATLHATTEFKRSRLHFFTDDFRMWEASNGG